MDEHIFVRWLHSPAGGIPCPVCKDEAGKELVLQMQNPFSYSEWLDLYRCPACQSCFYHPFEPPDYRTALGFAQEVKFYLEIGAGIDFMIGPIARLASMADYRSLLDVGCGFGFVVDFARRVLGWEAAGVEPSPYGREGARLLNIHIYQDYLERLTDLKEARFDVVFSSEVIEHVQNPLQFIELARNCLNPAGLLILTTPNASSVRPGTPHVVLLGILSPGLHSMLFSRQSLEKLLSVAGFKEILVEEEEERLVAYASDVKLRPLGRTQEARELYIRYLEELLQVESTCPALTQGIAYRLFRERVNGGQYREAEYILTRLLEAVVAEYGETALEPEAATALAEGAASWVDFGERLPYNLPCIYYYLGMFQLNHARDYDQAQKLFRAAFDIARTCLSLNAGIFQEAATLLWRMKLHEGLSYLYAGRREEALEKLRFILDHRERCPEFHYTEPPTDVVASAVYQSGIAELQRGRYGRALDWFLAAIDEAESAGLEELLREAARHSGLALAQAFERTMDKLSSHGEELSRLCRGELVRAVTRGAPEGQAAPTLVGRRLPWRLWRR